jgi:hypothetical protein
VVTSNELAEKVGAAGVTVMIQEDGEALDLAA